MTAGRRQRKPHLDHGDGLVGRALSDERRDKRRTLHFGQIAKLLDECPEILGFHIASPPPRTTRRPSLDIKSNQSR